MCLNLLFSLNGYCEDKYLPLTEESILNTHIFTSFKERKVKLTNGIYREKTPNPQKRVAVLKDLIVRGDLNNDGNEDIGVIYVENGGGNGESVILAVFLNEKGKPRNIDSYLIGDRIYVEKIYYKKASIFVQAVIQGENDALCCPSERVLMKFILKNNKLVKDREITLRKNVNPLAKHHGN